MCGVEPTHPRRSDPMLSPDALYPGIHGVVQAMGVARSGAGEAGLASLVTAVLLGQSLRRAELGRAQASKRSVPARQRYLRVARGLTRPWLSSAELTPHLIRAALAVVDDPEPHLAMDTVRCGAWESITVGVVWHGRVLPIGWAVLPYPWPKGAFTPAVTRLLWRIGAAWPAERRPHLVADRGFPSLALFRTLEQLGWGWTIRLRARLTVGVDGLACPLRDLLAQARPGAWSCRAITYGTGRQRVPGRLVLGRGDALPLLPRHQANPGSARQRRRQQVARQREVRGKHPTRRTSSAEQTDGWLILFTSHPDWLPASRSYTSRWSTEGSYRDAQGGYDGRHGWDLRADGWLAHPVHQPPRLAARESELHQPLEHRGQLPRRAGGLRWPARLGSRSHPRAADRPGHRRPRLRPLGPWLPAPILDRASPRRGPRPRRRP